MCYCNSPFYYVHNPLILVVVVLLLWKAMIWVIVVVIAVRWIDLRYNIAAIKTSPIL